ncbi:MAG: tRNA 2-thiouridine(34) synthase MnmA, partial [Deltaproteobacteria bacterium]|nr:tRNA 2-thiouridine(34) synthase MnmA [Deltaproteobacteria bacterium]
RHAPELEAAGEIVDEAGRVLGQHEGYHRYTLGQRRGLGLAGGPWFVIAVDPGTRRVVVGPEERLMRHEVFARGVNLIRAPGTGPLRARLRHRGALVPCEILSLDPLQLRLLAPARAVTPGQSVVVYEGDELCLGGIIARAA